MITIPGDFFDDITVLSNEKTIFESTNFLKKLETITPIYISFANHDTLEIAKKPRDSFNSKNVVFENEIEGNLSLLTTFFGNFQNIYPFLPGWELVKYFNDEFNIEIFGYSTRVKWHNEKENLLELKFAYWYDAIFFRQNYQSTRSNEYKR